MDEKQLNNFWPNIEKKDDKENVTFEMQPLPKMTVSLYYTNLLYKAATVYNDFINSFYFIF
jgi:hypothetical protein